MRFQVKDTSAAFLDAMNSRAGNITVASYVALTRTAKKVQQAQYDLMRTRLDRPTRYTLNSLYVNSATKTRLEATVETRLGFNSTPAGRYLSPLVFGGGRQMKAHEKQLGFYTAPSRQAPLDASGNVPGSFYKKVLSQLKVSSDPLQNATDSKRSKRKRKAESFFIVGNVLLSRKGEGAANPMLFLFKKVPTYKRLLPWYETAQEVIDQTLPAEFFKALDEFQRDR